MICTIEGVGLWGSGFSHWNDFVEHTHKHPGAEFETALSAREPLPDKGPKPEVIPARERRRAPLAVKMAVEVASQAFENTQLLAAETACVFGSGMGDTSITDHMCRAVATADKLLSPTKFHNSVHNAAAGYWTISSDCMMPANSVSSFTFTTSTTLLETITQCVVQQRPVLMVVFDIKTPSTLYGSMLIKEDFAAAVLLTPGPADKRARAEIEIRCDRAQRSRGHNTESHYQATDAAANPATELVPLLRCIATGDEESLELPVGISSSLYVHISATDMNRQQVSA